MDDDTIKRLLEICMEIVDDESVRGHHWYPELVQVLEEANDKLDSKLDEYPA